MKRSKLLIMTTLLAVCMAGCGDGKTESKEKNSGEKQQTEQTEGTADLTEEGNNEALNSSVPGFSSNTKELIASSAAYDFTILVDQDVFTDDTYAALAYHNPLRNMVSENDWISVYRSTDEYDCSCRIHFEGAVSIADSLEENLHDMIEASYLEDKAHYAVGNTFERNGYTCYSFTLRKKDENYIDAGLMIDVGDTVWGYKKGLFVWGSANLDDPAIAEIIPDENALLDYMLAMIIKEERVVPEGEDRSTYFNELLESIGLAENEAIPCETLTAFELPASDRYITKGDKIEDRYLSYVSDETGRDGFITVRYHDSHINVDDAEALQDAMDNRNFEPYEYQGVTYYVSMIDLSEDSGIPQGIIILQKINYDNYLFIWVQYQTILDEFTDDMYTADYCIENFCLKNLNGRELTLEVPEF